MNGYGNIMVVNSQTEKWSATHVPDVLGKPLEVLVFGRFRDNIQHTANGFKEAPG